MVALAYAPKRSELAKSIGLGSQEARLTTAAPRRSLAYAAFSAR